jgi:hypothetical protein
MTGIVAQLLFFLIALALVLLASMWYTRVLIDKMVGSKHRDLEAITSSCSIPESWSAKFERRMIGMREKGDEKRLGQIRSAARRSYLRRLSRLSEYVRRTRFVENEEVRKNALRALQRLDREWRSAADESVS